MIAIFKNDKWKENIVNVMNNLFTNYNKTQVLSPTHIFGFQIGVDIDLIEE